MAKPLSTLSSVSETRSRKQTPPTIAKERKRERRNPQMPPPGFAFTPPDRIERILELSEDPARAKKRKQYSDDRGQQTFTGLSRFLGDVLYDITALLSRK